VIPEIIYYRSLVSLFLDVFLSIKSETVLYENTVGQNTINFQ